MSESDIITGTPTPRTRDSLAADLRALGLQAGMTVLVHSAISKLGWVCGGPIAVVQALMDVLTPTGTLVMPAHTGDFSDPAEWRNPPVPADWVSIIRETMPAFDPRITPAWRMGRIAETFRTWPGVVRSDHPSVSFCAWGQHAAAITAEHALEYSLGEQSPLARIYELDGAVLLLGVGFGNNTSFHLAEYRTQRQTPIMLGAPILEGGQRVWKTYRDIHNDDEPFAAIGADFEQTGQVRVGPVGSATARLFGQRAAVDFAVRWLDDHHARQSG